MDRVELINEILCNILDRYDANKDVNEMYNSIDNLRGAILNGTLNNFSIYD